MSQYTHLSRVEGCWRVDPSYRKSGRAIQNGSEFELPELVKLWLLKILTNVSGNLISYWRNDRMQIPSGLLYSLSFSWLLIHDCSTSFLNVNPYFFFAGFRGFSKYWPSWVHLQTMELWPETYRKLKKIFRGMEKMFNILQQNLSVIPWTAVSGMVTLFHFHVVFFRCRL